MPTLMLIMPPLILWTTAIILWASLRWKGTHTNSSYCMSLPLQLLILLIYEHHHLTIAILLSKSPNTHAVWTPAFMSCKAFTHDAWEDLRVFLCIIPCKAHFRCVYPLSFYYWGQWAWEWLSYGRTHLNEPHLNRLLIRISELDLEWTRLLWKWHGRAWTAQWTRKAE